MRIQLLTILFALLGTWQLAAQDKKEWTIIAYVVGTDIVGDAITDLGEMRTAGNTDNVNIVTLRGGSKRAGWETAKSFLIENGQDVPLSFVPADTDMVGPSAITEFIDYAIDNYPAERYMLVFYNHGLATRGFGWQEIIDAQTSIGELKTGIGASKYVKGGNKFEIIGFDACLMASLETMASLKDYGNYYIASEEEEPWHAWFWTPIIQAMNSTPKITAPKLGEVIVNGFMQQSVRENTHAVTLSVVDLSKIAALESSLERFFASLNDSIYLASLLYARTQAEEYAKSISDPGQSEDMVDIRDLIDHMYELEPSIIIELDDVYNSVSTAVHYQRSDKARPHATGINMFIPLNKLGDKAGVNSFISRYYNSIPMSSKIKDFITKTYLPFALADKKAIKGVINTSLTGILGTGGAAGKNATGVYSAIDVDAHQDLDHLQVILMEEIAGDPDEYILLGSTLPDTIVENADSSRTYGYEWDEKWLGINGHPAYISDIHHVDFPNRETGEIDSAFTRIHIPAILYPNSATDTSMEIHFSFAFDEDLNFELEGILRESYGDSVLVIPKDRIRLQPGDRIQLVYEIFDIDTHEGYFVPEPGAVFDITSGNEDVKLEEITLPGGKYHLGFVLLDHAQNDTLIYDPAVYEINVVNTDDRYAELFAVTVSPNPTSGLASVNFAQPVTGDLSVFDVRGSLVSRMRVAHTARVEVDLSALASGTYWLQFVNRAGRVSRKVVKLH